MNTIPYDAPAVEIASLLTGKTVRYLADHSTVTKNGVRVLKIDAVENVAFAKSTGKRYVTVLAKDVDDGGESKHRNLHLAGIDLVV